MGLTFTIGGEVELDPAADWNAQKIAYGRQVVMAVADEVIPQLLTQLGVERTSPPESHIQASSSLDNVSNTKKVSATVLSIRDKISGTFLIQGDRDMSVGDLVFNVRDLIAIAVADSAIFALEHRLEGKLTSDMNSRIRREDGKIMVYERTEAPEETDRHPPVLTSSRRH